MVLIPVSFNGVEEGGGKGEGGGGAACLMAAGSNGLLKSFEKD